MRLYQYEFKIFRYHFIPFSNISSLYLDVACQKKSLEQLRLKLSMEISSRKTSAPYGTSIGSVLDEMGIIIGQLDIVSPQIYTIIDQRMRIVITRVSENIEIRRLSIPYNRQEFPNESMVAGEIGLLQAGETG